MIMWASPGSFLETEGCRNGHLGRNLVSRGGNYLIRGPSALSWALDGAY
jgi:hypothetical protein